MARKVANTHANPALKQEIIPSEKALGLLGAAAFSLTFSALIWSDDEAAATLIHAPVHRIPKTAESFNSWLGGEARRIRDAAIDGLTQDGAAYEIIYPMSGFDGASLWMEERGERINGKGTRAELIIGTLRDVTAARQAEMKAAWRAHHDDVTKIWNRVRFAEALAYELSASEFRPQKGFVAALGLSSLGDMEVQYPPDAKDYMLESTAKYLRRRFQSPNSVARINTSTFAILLPGLSETDAQLQLEAAADWISARAHPSLYGDLSMTCDISALPLLSGPSATERMALLESQMRPYSDRFNLMGADVSVLQSAANPFTAHDILAALNERKLALAYQPIIDARTRHVCHFEGLMRLIGPDGHPTSAWQMILASEQLGYVHLLDRRALEIGAETLRTHPRMCLALNVSAGTLNSDEARDGYIEALKALGPLSSRLTLELTETLALDDPRHVATFAEAARAMGCKFAIDDFGSGHATFQNLMSIEADIIKIDGQMVRDLSSAPHKQVFVRMIVDLAKTLNMETVAEMVSSEADAALMARMGVTYLQGFIFGKPELLPVFDAVKSDALH